MPRGAEPVVAMAAAFIASRSNLGIVVTYRLDSASARTATATCRSGTRTRSAWPFRVMPGSTTSCCPATGCWYQPNPYPPWTPHCIAAVAGHRAHGTAGRGVLLPGVLAPPDAPAPRAHRTAGPRLAVRPLPPADPVADPRTDPGHHATGVRGNQDTRRSGRHGRPRRAQRGGSRRPGALHPAVSARTAGHWSRGQPSPTGRGV